VTNIILNAGVETISNYAFGYCADQGPLVDAIEFPSSLINVDPGAFMHSASAFPADAWGNRYADKGKTFLLRSPNATVPEGPTTIASMALSSNTNAVISVPASIRNYGSDLVSYSTAREVIFLSSAPLNYNTMFYQTYSVTNVTLYGGSQEVGSFADSPSLVTTVGFLTTPPDWDVTNKFPHATTVRYDAKRESAWTAYKTAHPNYTYLDDLVAYTTVAFDKNAIDATGTMDPLEFVEYDVSTNLPACSFVRTGYTFIGWATDPADGEVRFGDGDGVKVPLGYEESEFRLYAVWTTTVYNVSYELNGGVNAPENPMNYTADSALIALAAPTRVGYAFAGWTPADEIPAGSTGDKTFTANWELALDAAPDVAHLEPKGATYNGFLGGESLEGTFSLVVSNPKKGADSAKATLTVTSAATGTKIKTVGEVDFASGLFTTNGFETGIILGTNAVAGTWNGAAVQGDRDAAKAKDNGKLAKLDAFNAKVYAVAFTNASGAARFTMAFSKKGKAKISGTLASGVKVSGAAQMCSGTGVYVLPFVWSKKNGPSFAFTAWFDEEGKLFDVSGFGTEFAPEAFGSVAQPDDGAEYAFTYDAVSESVSDPIDATPDMTVATWDGKKFVLEKAAKVTYKNDEVIIVPEESGNIPGLSLKYSKGSLSGSFTVYSVDSTKNKLVKNKFTVTGVMIDGVGYVSATAKNLQAITVKLKLAE